MIFLSIIDFNGPLSKKFVRRYRIGVRAQYVEESEYNVYNCMDTRCVS